MVFVALAALVITALRAAFDHPGPISELLVVGALPMATLVVIGLVIGYGHRSSRPFILGFESFGVLALALSVVVGCNFVAQRRGPYVGRWFADFVASITGWDTVPLTPISYSVAVAVLALPQVTFALIGGFLSRKYRITITKRPAQFPSES